ncbi:MAG: hypothetical protein ACRETY_08435 [Steroidobacteraceae bacterium]
MPQADTAQFFGVITRWIQELEERGIPSRGYRSTREYPLPDAWWWYFAYKLRVNPRRGRALPEHAHRARRVVRAA